MSIATRDFKKYGFCVFEVYEHFIFNSCYAFLDTNSGSLRFFVSERNVKEVLSFFPFTYENFLTANVDEKTRIPDVREVVTITNVKQGRLLLGHMEVKFADNSSAFFQTNKGLIKFITQHLLSTEALFKISDNNVRGKEFSPEGLEIILNGKRSGNEAIGMLTRNYDTQIERCLEGQHPRALGGPVSVLALYGEMAHFLAKYLHLNGHASTQARCNRICRDFKRHFDKVYDDYRVHWHDLQKVDDLFSLNEYDGEELWARALRGLLKSPHSKLMLRFQIRRYEMDLEQLISAIAHFYDNRYRLPATAEWQKWLR